MTARSSGRPRSLWSGLALSAATVVVCLLAGEFITRLWDPSASLWHWPYYAVVASQPSPGETQFTYDPTLGWAPIAGSSGAMLGKPFSFTDEGTREQNRDRPPATGPLIMAFGDSMTEGFAVGNDETWPAHLERLTGRRVLNAGVRGYGLDQIVLRAERIVPEIKPSTVVLAFIADDILRTALAVRDAKGKPYFVPEGEGLALHNVPVQVAGRSSLMMAARHLLGYSHLFDRIVNRLGVQQSWYGREVATGADPFNVSCRLMDRIRGPGEARARQCPGGGLARARGVLRCQGCCRTTRRVDGTSWLRSQGGSAHAQHPRGLREGECWPRHRHLLYDDALHRPRRRHRRALDRRGARHR